VGDGRNPLLHDRADHEEYAVTAVLRSYRDDTPPADRWKRLVWVGAPTLLIAGLLPGAVALIASKEAGLWVGLTLAWFVLVGTLSSTAGTLGWLVPPIIRGAEYGLLIGLTYWIDPAAMPAGFAALAAISYHEYNLVYRQRYQPTGPPQWLSVVLGGWQIRMIVVFVLAAADLLTPGLWVLAGWVAAIAVTESAFSWRRAVSFDIEMESDESVLD
jgi:hypothetical protein